MKKNSKEETSYPQELLKSLHLLTVDGKLNQDSRRKLKQIEHLNNFIIPLIQFFEDRPFTLVDIGAGKSYLGFILYNKILYKLKNSKFIGIESRQELVEKSIQLAKKLNFERMNFLAQTVQEVNLNKSIVTADMVTALHACDSATDDAIKLALDLQSKFIFLIPCCQAEVAATLKGVKAQLNSTSLQQLLRHPIHTREFGSHLTNVLRCLLLETKGYQVTVTEFTGLEHSLKNELIIAKNIKQPNKKSEQDLRSLIDQFQLKSLVSRFIY